MSKLNAVMAILLVCLGVAAEEQKWDFRRGKWNSADWLEIKNPRWEYFGKWIQEKDHIRNAVPTGEPPEVLQGKRAAETFSSMLVKDVLKGNAKASCTMSFDYRMAPEIVLAGPLGKSAKEIPEFREYWEIVLFDEGINVWHHEMKDGKPFWRKAAFVSCKFEKDRKYTMEAEVVFTAKCPMLNVSCSPFGDKKQEVKFGCMLPTLPKEYYIGISGCEGKNRFYDFTLNRM